MRRIISLLISLLWLIQSGAQVTITVELTNKKQTIFGLGAHADDPPLVDDYLNDIGISHARFYVGAKSGTDIGGYVGFEEVNDNAYPDTLDTANVMMIPTAKAQAFTKIKNKGIPIHVTIGSPPVWQKRTDTLMAWQKYPGTSYPNAHDSAVCGGKLRYDMYDEFAEFCEAVVYRFKSQLGIDLYAFGLQDEPEFIELYPACVYTKQEMVNVYKKVGKRFLDRGIATKLIFAEQCFPQGNIYNWSKAANDDAECKNYIHAFAVHAYSSDPMGGGMSTPAQYTQLLEEANRVAPYKEIWQNEGGPGVIEPGHTTLENAIGGALEFYRAMYYGNATLFMIYRTDKSEDLRYYSVKNMIRYIRPGAYMVNVTSSDPSVLALAFRNDTLEVTTIYLANTGSTAKTISFNGLTGKFEAFETSNNHFCEWVGQRDLSTSITLPPMSIQTLFLNGKNKLPDITAIDTIALLKNSGLNTITLTGINDGGEGDQAISLTAERVVSSGDVLSAFSVSYTSPETTAQLKLTPKADILGSTSLLLSLQDNSQGYYNEKVLQVPVYIIPYINNAPSFDSISDQHIPYFMINSTQYLYLTGTNDGNGGIQKLSLSASSSNTGIATVTTGGSTQIKITPKAEGTVTITVTLRDDGDSFLGGKNYKTRTFNVIVGSGISAFKPSEEQYRIYPNPAKGSVTISNPGSVYQAASVIDMNGKICISTLLSSDITQIDISSLPAGVYIVRLVNGNIAATAKLIVQ